MFQASDIPEAKKTTSQAFKQAPPCGTANKSAYRKNSVIREMTLALGDLDENGSRRISMKLDYYQLRANGKNYEHWDNFVCRAVVEGRDPVTLVKGLEDKDGGVERF